MSQFISIQDALNELREGRMIILVDDEHREQEGDLVIAAQKVTPESINFMTQYGRGVVCLTLTDDIVERLRIPLMPERNTHANQAAFTMSIEAAKGVATGVSAHDRAHTIQVAVNPQSGPCDIAIPGHIFPLKARRGGVLERPGHTEGSVDLAKLAGLQSAAVICEIMKPDGTMARVKDLQEFSKHHNIKLVSINDLIEYRMKHEITVDEVASAPLPLKIDSSFSIKIFRDRYNDSEHIALVHGDIKANQPCLVRIHSECLTGDVFGSLRCDCGEQLESALKKIAKEGGVVLYMRQEGRGIGLANKIKAYELQTQGLDTVEANEKLGFLADHRQYGLSAQMLKSLGVTKIRLMTNNPRKFEDMEKYGIEVAERVAVEMKPNQQNAHYLKTKRDKLGHILNLDEDQ
jgi:3,4-dihydroxy 2-butanone 4-phosphate synthase/GTP cyclohydrolase II